MDEEASGQAIKRRGANVLSPVQRRMVFASGEIKSKPPEKTDFLHSVMCQAGLPRSQVEGRTFSRTAGGVSIEIEAGTLWNGRDWVEQPLPYGTKPRLALVHLSSEAVIKRSRDVEIGNSIRGFLETLGISATGGRNGSHNSFKMQMMALAACRMRIGLLGESGHARTVDTLMIEEVETWLHPDTQAAWQGTITLSQRFYDTLIEHAVPLDRRALGALQHSALALDTYTWLAHRLCRIKESQGLKLSWSNLRAQFGQEYVEIRDFKREMRNALGAALTVYPDARVTMETGGILLRLSQPPVPRIAVQVRLPKFSTRDRG